ncbi:hypothetical protein FB390_6526 [Nocardia bhagyanarayanae]|uniref:Uncharacterized protein n=2 Tax=Nocardia bhagyanarayanae TaxID=1215925 RepID=A0A543EXM3_9NOCA|nr:hypothetical protein FB390_6526 [Nocardia bhagyanarayanae]
MCMSDQDTELIYLVEISRPGRSEELWWRVGNVGTPAQTSAALAELARRVCRDLLSPEPRRCDRARRCWYHCRVSWPDGVVLDEVEGRVQAFLLAVELWRASAIAGSAIKDADT